MISKNNNATDVAIVGISCAFPGAHNKDHYWQLLVNNQTAIDLPEHSVEPGRMAAEGILDKPYHFDAGYFNISPRDAKLMDPQHRKLLEHSVLALADANVIEHGLDNRIGTFLSVGANQYYTHCLANSPYHHDTNLQYSLTLGNSHHCVATQVAYQLNLQGPAYTVSTACSSSLVAIYQACKSLVSGESDLALAGGASINTPHGQGYEFMDGSVLSKTGRCLPFSAQSDGTVPASGIGVVALKRLSDALQDKDVIYAVIKGGAINNDGTRKVGYTAPSREGQVDVIRRALQSSGVNTQQVAFIECHGTATSLGDPIEVEALASCYQLAQPDSNYALGSVKWNIGHTDTAAGVAGLIKVALSLKHNLMIGSPYLAEYNPELHMEDKPFYVPRQNTPYPKQKSCAAVSSFGMGGTNCHMILSAPPFQSTSTKAKEQTPYVVPISSRHEGALVRQEQQLADWIENTTECNLADIAGVQMMCRPADKYRRYHIAETLEQLIQSLRGSEVNATRSTTHAETVLLVEGQGAAIQGAALEYYENSSRFRTLFDRCIEGFERQPGIPKDLRLVALDPSYEKCIKSHFTLYAQPILFSLQYALAHTLQHHGVVFKSFIGHSLGEWIAAAIAGLWSFDDAIRLIACRATSIQACDDGAMLAIFSSEESVRPYLSGSLTIAAINGTKMTTVSGEALAIEQLADTLRAKHIRCKPLQTNKAFHNPMINSAVAPLREVLSSITYHPVKGNLYSNLSGKKVTFRHVSNPDYWIEQLLRPVQMAATLSSLKSQRLIFTDVGISPAMSNMLVAHSASWFEQLIRVPQVLNDEALYTTIGKLWAHGVAIALPLVATFEWKKVNLPGYAFEQTEYYQTPSPPIRVSSHKRPVDEWFYQDSWVCQRLPNTSAAVARDMAGYNDWYQRDDQLIYRGFSDCETISPKHLADFLNQLNKFVREGKSECYVLIKVSHPAFSHQVSECYRRALGALVTVIAQEAQQITIHVVGHSCDSDIAMRTDLRTITKGAPIVHIDGHYVWKKTLVPAKGQTKEYLWPETGYVLISGGLGKIGLSWAKYLVEQTSLHVVLTGRKSAERLLTPLSVLPDSLISTLENAQALATLIGSERVHYSCIDVADATLLQDRVKHFNTVLGPINGVIHCAVYTSPEGMKPVFASPEPVIAQHFKAKVDGTLALAKLCDQHQPDFCILMSSISTQLGGFNLGVYAYTNQFMNEFVSTQSGRSTRWMSVSWDGWDLQNDPNLAADIKALAIDHKDCDEAFSWVFNHLSMEHCIASTHDIYPRLSQWVSDMSSHDQHPTTLSREKIQHIVHQIFCDLLGLERVDFSSNFFDMGGGSVVFSALVAEIRSKLDMVLPLHEFMNEPTLSNTVNILVKSASPALKDREMVFNEIKAIFEELLGMPNLRESSHFFECGGDSLVFTQLAKRIKQSINFDLSLSEFIDAPTIAHLTQLICGDRKGDETDTYQDLQLTDGLWPASGASAQGERVFLVTGAAGLLGVNLVTQLLSCAEVTQVIALVRAKDHAAAKERMLAQLLRFAPEISTAKLNVICGDVSKPRLGLTEEDHAQLSQQVTDILHNAAHVNHIFDYATLKASNTLSMLSVLELAALECHKNIHFVSTLACVSELNTEEQYVEILPTLRVKPAKHLNGYARSKWASEVLLEQATRRGFSINVVRPSSIVGHSKHGTFNADSDHIWLYVKGCLQLASYPEMDNEINITPVDFMSKLIVSICLINENKVYNLPTPHVLQMKDIFDELTARGYRLERLSSHQWQREASNSVDQDNALYPILSYYLGDGPDETVVAPDYGNVVVENTSQLMTELQLCYPQPEYFMGNLIEYLEKVEFFGERNEFL